MATLLGRIRRISADVGNPTNYTVTATSAYDADAPAATAATWGTDADRAALDQSVTIPVPPAAEIEHEGALVTFDRLPFLFTSAVVKIRPTYDFDAGENPFLELWTHDASEDAWTRRRSVQLASGFVGVPSGQAKFFELFLAVPLEDVDAVWVTMAPGVTGTPVMRFVALHVFGQCQLEPTTSGSCEDDPTIDCLDPEDPTLNPPSNPNAPFPTPNWPGVPPDAGGPVPPSAPPPFPTVDLCDPAALEALKAQLTPEQLDFLQAQLDAALLPCLDPDTQEPNIVGPINEDPDNPGEPLLPRQPIEQYLDPQTLEPEADPKGGGSGSSGGDGPFRQSAHHFFFFSSSAQMDNFFANLADESPDVQNAVNRVGGEPVQYDVFGGGPDGALDRVTFTAHGVTLGDRITIEAFERISVGIFDGFPSSSHAATITAGTRSFWILERAGNTTDFGATVKGSPLDANEVAVSSIEAAAQVTAVSAGNDVGLDGMGHPTHTEPTEALVIPPDTNFAYQKHLVATQNHCDDPPPHIADQTAAHQQFYFIITLQKRVASWAPSQSEPQVFVTAATALDVSSIVGAAVCPGD